MGGSDFGNTAKRVSFDLTHCSTHLHRGAAKNDFQDDLGRASRAHSANRCGSACVPVTSTIETAKLISRVQPVYPALAIQARIQGNVVLHAIIGRDGEVSELQVLSGDPLVVNAAVEAVRQWRYSPTLLNGQAVEVETTITVSFVLGQ
jgi:TonB family protein